MFLEPIWLLQFEHDFFFLESFRGLLSYLIEFISFHSLFTLLFVFITLMNSIKDGHICRPLFECLLDLFFPSFFWLWRVLLFGAKCMLRGARAKWKVEMALEVLSQRYKRQDMSFLGKGLLKLGERKNMSWRGRKGRKERVGSLK